MSPSSNCPTPATLALLWEGKLDEGIEDALASHIDDCRSCQETLLHIQEAPLDSVIGGLRSPSAKDLTQVEESCRLAVQRAAAIIERQAAAPKQPGAETPRVDADGTTLTHAGESDVPHVGDGAAIQLPQYELLGEIARGGMGIVFKARHRKLNRLVALKIHRLGPMASSAEGKRFHLEAEAAAKLDHPHIVPIYEVGEASGHAYLAMALVEGQSLAQAVASGPLAPREAASVMKRVAEAVAYAHGQNVVHRDLKPANILLDAAGQPRITDFGLAKRVDTDSSLTQAGQVMGTPSYMSPEQAQGRNDQVGTQADVYSLGATLYCLLSGRPPFQAASALDTLKQVVEREPVPPSLLNPAVARDLDTICLKCLEKAPERRYISASALAGDLGRWLSGEPIAARPISHGEHFIRWVKRRPALAALIAVLCLGILVLLIGSWWYAHDLGAAYSEVETREREAQDERKKALANLYQSLVEEAHAVRESRVSGYRLAALRLLQRALAVDTPGRDLAALRQDAVACLGDFVGLAPAALNGFPAAVVCAEVDPAGSQVALGLGNGKVLIVDLPDGKTRTLIDAHRSPVAFAGFLADGHLLSVEALGNTAEAGARTKFWSRTSTGAWTLTAQMNTDSLFSVSLAPDGKWLLCVAKDGSRVDVWDLERKVLAGSLPGGPRDVFQYAAMNPSGDLICTTNLVGNTRALRVWEWPGRKMKGGLVPELQELHQPCFSPDGKLLACPSDAGVAVYALPTWNQRLFMRGDFAFAVKFSPDGQMLAIPSVQLGVVRLWNLATNRDAAVLRFPAPRLVAFARDQKKLIALSENNLRVWNLEGAGDKRVLSPHPGGVSAVAFTSNGKLLAAGGKDRCVSLWNPVTGQRVRRIANLPLPVQTLAFSPDGNWLAFSFGAGGRIVSTSDEHQQADFPQPLRGHVVSIAFSPDARHVAISSSDARARGGVSLWKAASASDSLRLSLVGWPTDVQAASLAFSPDGRHLAWIEVVGDQRTLRIWDMKESKVRTLTGARPTHWIHALDFTPDGRGTFVNDKNEAETWDLDTGKRLQAFTGAGMEKHSGITTWCATCSLSPDGAWYAVASRAVSVWDAHTGRMLLALPPETSPVLSLAWSPNREYLAVGSADGGLAVWHIPTVRAQLSSLGLDW